ncbi:JAB domain-containing protein [Dokdonella immobilis]|uniref:JAB domain-containing protein n=1 Tax=Dokdonella immobilis TaxID=578942 RepID=UPI000B847C6D|nr:JAB domain-containing protein [Dokdonella immobilis]
MNQATRDVLGHYHLSGPQTEADILSLAEGILLRRLERLGWLTDPKASADFLRARLGNLEHEEFHAVWLDNRHGILGVQHLFTGTVDGCSVYPREVLRHALRIGAAAVIFAHNHPSGSVEPSAADRAITIRLRDALTLVDIRVLDHLVVGASGTTSLAQRGWI